MRGSLAPLVLLLLTAGCLDGSEDDGGSAVGDGTGPGVETTVPPENADRVVSPGADLGSSTAPFQVIRLPFHKNVDGAKSSVGTEDEDAVLDVDLTGATTVLLELAWDSPIYDLDPNLIFLDECPEGGDLGEFTTCMPQEAQDHWTSDGDDGNYWVRTGSLGQPDSPVRIAVGRDALAAYGCELECVAMARAIVKDLAINVDGELVLTVVRGGDLPEGYTALA